MTNFVLVHGEWHGAWMWQSVSQHLEVARGRLDVGEVVALDLPGHGKRGSDSIRRITRDYYVEAVVTATQVRRLSGVILVVHSLAATFMPQVLSLLGPVVSRLVLIGGRLPPEGGSAFDALPIMDRLLVRIFKPREKGVWFPSFLMKRRLFHASDDVDAQDILSHLVPDPFQPWTALMHRDGFPGGVPVTYVLLARDRSLPLSLQRRYAQSLGSPTVVELDAGHEAPLTHSREIADLLLSYVERERKEPLVETKDD